MHSNRDYGYDVDRIASPFDAFEPAREGPVNRNVETDEVVLYTQSRLGSRRRADSFAASHRSGVYGLSSVQSPTIYAPRPQYPHSASTRQPSDARSITPHPAYNPRDYNPWDGTPEMREINSVDPDPFGRKSGRATPSLPTPSAYGIGRPNDHRPDTCPPSRAQAEASPEPMATATAGVYSGYRPRVGESLLREQATQRRRESEPKYTCHCGGTFTTVAHLRVHGERHSSERIYPCDVDGCLVRFRTKDDARSHLRRKHQGIISSRLID